MLKRYIKKEKQSFKNENEVSSNPRINYIITKYWNKTIQLV